ncbi:MAG: hypothetical protein U0572_11285 [Phycisphaerales bacterium]
MPRPYERARIRLLVVGAVTFGSLAIAVASAAIGTAFDVDSMVGIGYLGVAASLAFGLPATVLLCIDYARVPKPEGHSPILNNLSHMALRAVGAIALVCGAALLAWHVVVIVKPIPMNRSMLERLLSLGSGVVILAVGIKWCFQPTSRRKGPG